LAVIEISPAVVAALPVDQLGLAILNDLIATKEWNEYNYLLAADTHFGAGKHRVFVT
jgi:hypothetical protein